MVQYPLLLAGLRLSLQLQAGAPQPDASIYGTITASDQAAVAGTGGAAQAEPVGLVLVEVTGSGIAPRRVTGDAAGSYAISGLDTGVYTLRFEREGYIALAVDVRVPAHGPVHLDVTLDRAPTTMKPIKVLAHDVRPRVAEPMDGFNAYRPWRLTGDEFQAMPGVDFPDVIRAVATSPNAQFSPESGGGLHLQGGSTDHTLLTVDGIPLYNAIHSGDRPSALDPDAVAAISVYGEPQARDGGRLSGVVGLSTRVSLPDSQHARLTIWPTGVRALTVLPVGRGSALVAARRNYARPSQGNTREPVTLGWSDFFATASLPVGRGDLTGMVFSSSDDVAFDAAPEENGTGMLQNANRFGWTSHAYGLTWRQDSGHRSVEARVWQSGTAVAADWLTTPSQSYTLGDTFLQTAASSSVSWAGRRTHTTIGASFEQLRARYDASGSTTSGGSLSTSSLLGFAGRSRIGSAFLEHSRALGDRLLVTLGERAVSIDGNGVLLEPRFAATLSAANGVTLSAAFARTHQYAQSLYNEESLVDAMASLEVPVLAGSGGIPVASSNSVSAQLAVPMGSSGLITVSGFARSFQGLVLMGPVSGAPFPTQSFTTGSGSAYGGRLGAREQIGRLSLEGAYSVSTVLRERSEQSYRPAFAPSHSILVAAGYELGQSTFLRAAGSISVLRPTSPILGSVAWEWQDVLTSQREVTGTPQYSPTSVGAGRLPAYFRFDVGVRHVVSLRRLHAGEAMLFANVDNVFGRRNAIGLTQDSGAAASRMLPMRPRSLSFGIALHF